MEVKHSTLWYTFNHYKTNNYYVKEKTKWHTDTLLTNNIEISERLEYKIDHDSTITQSGVV